MHKRKNSIERVKANLDESGNNPSSPLPLYSGGGLGRGFRGTLTRRSSRNSICPGHDFPLIEAIESRTLLSGDVFLGHLALEISPDVRGPALHLSHEIRVANATAVTPDFDVAPVLSAGPIATRRRLAGNRDRARVSSFRQAPSSRMKPVAGNSLLGRTGRTIRFISAAISVPSRQ